MKREKNNRVALICNVGFSSNWHPFGISLLKENIESSSNIKVDNYYFSSEFSFIINKKYPQYIEINDAICEYGRSYHEIYYATKIFQLGKPDKQIKKVLLDLLKKKDIYRQRLTEKTNIQVNHTIVKALASFILEYCYLIDNFINKKITDIKWEDYDLIGFSCLSSQLLCSIHFAHKLRKANYEGIILFGGGMFRKWNVKQYCKMFPLIDDFIVGDGYNYLVNVIKEKSKSVKESSNKRQDHYGDFSDIPKSVLRSELFHIPIQLSENCSWSKCLFCGIKPSRICNSRSPKLVAEWIDWFSETHRVSNFGFVDCDLNGNLNEFNDLCSYLINGKNKVKLYGMFNTVNLNKKTCANIKAAGFEYVFLGADNFSNKMLSLMKKKSRKIDNIKGLKWLLEENINNISFNIMIDFPGVNKKIIKENIDTFNYIIHLIDKRVECNLIEFDLERDSNAYKLRKELNINDVNNYNFDEICYPKAIRKKLKFHSLKYKWKRMAEGWNDFAKDLNLINKKQLIYERKGEKIIIYDKRDENTVIVFNKKVAKIYELICNDILGIKDISNICGEDYSFIEDTLNNFHLSKLAIKEKNKYLGLAIPKANCN